MRPRPRFRPQGQCVLKVTYPVNFPISEDFVWLEKKSIRILLHQSYLGLTSLRVASMTSVVMSVPRFKDSAASKSGMTISSPSSSSSFCGPCLDLSAASPTSSRISSSFWIEQKIMLNFYQPIQWSRQSNWSSVCVRVCVGVQRIIFERNDLPPRLFGQWFILTMAVSS